MKFWQAATFTVAVCMAFTFVMIILS